MLFWGLCEVVGRGLHKINKSYPLAATKVGWTSVCLGLRRRRRHTIMRTPT